MARHLTFLGLPNHVASPLCEITTTGVGGLIPPEMGPEWLKTEEPSELSRLLTLDPAHSRWFMDFVYGGVEIHGLAAVNVNFSPSGKFRFTGNASASHPVPSKQPPNAILSSTNVIGAVTDVDEDVFSPDANYLDLADNEDDWVVRFGWAALTDTPVPGYAMCQIVTRFKMFSFGVGSTISYPRVEIELWESGGLVQSLGHRAVTNDDTDGQVLIFTFDPSVLADPTCSNLEVQIAGEKGERLSGDYHYAKLGSIQLYYEEADIVDYDSGWIDVPRIAETPEAPTLNVHYLPQTAWLDVRTVSLLVIDDQAAKDPFTPVVGLSGVPAVLVSDPPQYVEAGVVVAGESIELTHGLLKPSTLSGRPMVEEVGGNSGAGQTYAADAFRYREWGEAMDPLVTREESIALLDKIGWRRGHSGAFYVVVEPDVEPIYQLFSSFWATLVEIDAPSPLPDNRYSRGGEMLFTMAIRVREKL